MMKSDTVNYLSYNDQEVVISKLRQAASKASLKESLFFENGDKFSGSMLFFSNLVYWRCGFRAFRLARYGKARMMSFFYSAVFPSVYGGFIHTTVVMPKLSEFYRREDMLYYGFLSAAVHQGGQAMGFITATGVTFFLAQRYGMLPIPIALHRNGAWKLALDYYIKSMKPYTKILSVTAALSTLAMFGVGILEYKQSKMLLARIDRKTISLDEIAK